MNNSSASDKDFVWLTKSCKTSHLSDKTWIKTSSSLIPACSSTRCSRKLAIAHITCSLGDPCGDFHTLMVSLSDTNTSGIVTQCLLLGKFPVLHSVHWVTDSPSHIHLIHLVANSKQAFCLFLLGQKHVWPHLLHSSQILSGSLTGSSSGSCHWVSFWISTSFQAHTFLIEEIPASAPSLGPYSGCKIKVQVSSQTPESKFWHLPHQLPPMPFVPPYVSSISEIWSTSGRNRRFKDSL